MINFKLPSLPQVIEALLQFIRMESFAGFLLIFSSLIALVLANSPLSQTYQNFIYAPFSFGIVSVKLTKPLILWINDGLMALFFLLIGLEIKREIIEGQLSNWSQIALPAIAALGGMIMPVLIYTALNFNHSSALRGWAIPAATDIAFALGMLSILKGRISNWLKIFLMTLAIFDDLAVIVIIAFFYSKNLSIPFLLLSSLVIMALILCNRLQVSKLRIYLLLGLLLWIGIFNSGIHATLTGIILALTIPHQGKTPGDYPLRRLENYLHNWVAYFILPFFAFANAGIDLTGFSPYTLTHPLALGIILGLFLGKQLGVFSLTYLAIKMRLATKPSEITWKQLYGVAILCGIGFTMSFFISSLTFDDNPSYAKYSQISRLAILTGSLLSAIVGYTMLRLVTRKDN